MQMCLWAFSLLLQLSLRVSTASVGKDLGSAPQWKQYFVSQRTAIMGVSTKLSCRVKGQPRPFIEWFKDGEAVAQGERLRINKYDLKLNDIQLSDAGTYACKASNQYGVLWGNLTLRVIEEKDDATFPFEDDEDDNDDPFSAILSMPAWTKRKDRANYVSGAATKSVELDCAVRGYPEPNITWYKHTGEVRVPINPSNSKYLSSHWKLKIDDLSIDDNGQYTCVVANIYGSISWTFTVHVLQRLPIAPIMEDVANQTAVEGDNVTFACKIVHSDSQPFLQWFQHFKVNDSYIDEKGVPHVNLLQQSSFQQDAKDPQELILRNVTKKDEGWYTCLTSNTVAMNYRSAFLTVRLAENVQAVRESTTLKNNESMLQKKLEVAMNQTRALSLAAKTFYSAVGEAYTQFKQSLDELLENKDEGGRDQEYDERRRKVI